MASSNSVTYGSLVIGSWVAAGIFGLEVDFAFQYNKYSSPKDRKTVKLLMAIMIAINSVALVGSLVGTYLATVTYWGDVTFIQEQHWYTTMFVSSGAVVTAIAQGILVLRYLHLRVIRAMFFALVMVEFGSGIAFAVLTLVWRTNEDLSLLSSAKKAHFIVNTFTNACISLAILFAIYKQSSGFKSTHPLSLGRFVDICLQAGSLPTFCMIGALLSAVLSPTTTLYDLFFWAHSHLYLLTILYSMNVNTPSNTSRGPQSKTLSDTEIYAMTGVHMFSEAVVQKANMTCQLVHAGPVKDALLHADLKPNDTILSSSSSYALSSMSYEPQGMQSGQQGSENAASTTSADMNELNENKGQAKQD